MKPYLRFGLIGGTVSLIILLSGTIMLENKPTLGRLFQYLLQLVVIISIVAAIKQTKDRSEETIELGAGMKAGIATTLVICIFLAAFNFIYQQSISREDLIKQSEESLGEYYSANPVKDTTRTGFESALKASDSAFKKENYRYSRFMLERAAHIRPGFENYSKKVEEVNKKMMDELTSPGSRLLRIFRQLIFFQLIIGMFISFVTTMLFRYRQQNL